MALVKRVSTKTRPVFVCTAAAIVVVEGSQRIVKITPDVYAFMLNYCRRGFTDVYADLRFVLSAGTHCPGIIIPLRHSRREQPKFWISEFELENSPSSPCPPPPPLEFSNRRFSPPNFHRFFYSRMHVVSKDGIRWFLFFFLFL